MIFPAEFKTISDYCIANQLVPTLPLRDWLMCGFPDDVQFINLEEHVVLKKNIHFRLRDEFKNRTNHSF